MTDQCNRCRFWREDMRERDPNDTDWGWGHCRRRPPRLVDPMVTAFMPPLRYGQQEDPEIDVVQLSSASLFPATNAIEWCGEFAPTAQPAALAVIAGKDAA